MKKTIFIFSALIVSVLILFQVSKYSILSGNVEIEWAIAIIAALFFIIGIVLNKQSLRKSNEKIENLKHLNPGLVIDELGISKREYQILKEIAQGHSNKEIAEKLFVTESTIKTHISNLYVKLNVKRRTQALQKAKELQLID